MKRRERPTKPRSGRSTVGTRRSKSKLAVTAISPKSGIAHHFNDLDALQALAKTYISKWNSQLEADLVESMRLWNWLNQQNLKGKFIAREKPVYRIVYAGWTVLKI